VAQSAILIRADAALDLYRGRLIADAAWEWLERPRSNTDRFVEAALRLADAWHHRLARQTRTPKSAAEAPDTDLAYVRLILNARARHDQDAIRLRIKQYVRPPPCTASESIAACSTTTVGSRRRA